MQAATRPTTSGPGIVGDCTTIDWDRGERLEPRLMRRIRNYDAQLHVYYDRGPARWVLCRLTPAGPRFIALWQTDEGAYLPLDDRIMDKIAAWDMWKGNALNGPKNAAELARRMDAEDTARVDKIDRDFRDDMDHLSRANRRYLYGVFQKAIGE